MIPVAHLVTHPMTARYFMAGQLGYLRSQGFEVTVVASPGPDLHWIATHEGVAVTAVPMAREPAPASDALALWRLVRLFRRMRPELVNAGTPKAGLLGMLAARLARVPVRVYTLRGLRLANTRGFRRRVLGASERLASSCAHRVLCNSESLRREYVALGLAQEEKSVVLGAGSSNGVDIERFRPRPDAGALLGAELGIPAGAPVVGFVGRLVRDKGLVDLAAAMKSVWEALPEARLLLVGEAELGDALPGELAARLAADTRVVTTGWVEDAAPYYSAMDLLAFPSYREGLPNAPLEAGASGLPVAGYAATGTVDVVVDGQTGTLVPIGDTPALGEAIARYLAEPTLRHAHGRAARALVAQRFRREAVWQTLAEEYRRLLGEPANP